MEKQTATLVFQYAWETQKMSFATSTYTTTYTNTPGAHTVYALIENPEVRYASRTQVVGIPFTMEPVGGSHTQTGLATLAMHSPTSWASIQVPTQAAQMPTQAAEMPIMTVDDSAALVDPSEEQTVRVPSLTQDDKMGMLWLACVFLVVTFGLLAVALQRRRYRARRIALVADIPFTSGLSMQEMVFNLRDSNADNACWHLRDSIARKESKV